MELQDIDSLFGISASIIIIIGALYFIYKQINIYKPIVLNKFRNYVNKIIKYIEDKELSVNQYEYNYIEDLAKCEREITSNQKDMIAMLYNPVQYFRILDKDYETVFSNYRWSQLNYFLRHEYSNWSQSNIMINWNNLYNIGIVNREYNEIRSERRNLIEQNFLTDLGKLYANTYVGILWYRR